MLLGEVAGLSPSTGWPGPSAAARRTSSTSTSGEGLGCAVLSDGEVRRGHAGLAGEIAHLVTVGPGGVAMRLTDVFAALGVRRPGSSAIDVRALLVAVESVEVRDTVARAVAGVVSAVVAPTDPAVVLVGASWGPSVPAALVRACADAPRRVTVEAALVTDEPALAAARETAVLALRDAVVARGVR